MFSLVKNRVMTTRELLFAEVKPDDDVYDKLFGSCFIAAAVEQEIVDNRKRWGLYLDDAPMVVFGEREKTDLGLHPDTPTIKQMRDLGSVEIGRENIPYGNFSLVSGGAIVFYDGKILCLKRDKYAIQDPGILTTPAGRMSEWLSTMSSLELAEEMIIVLKHNKSGKLLVLAGYRDGHNQLNENDILVKKMKQIAKMSEFYSERAMSEAKILDNLTSINDIMTINLDKFICQNMLDERADQVFTFDGYRIKDQCSGYVFFDVKNNTLEYREIFDFTLPGFSLYAIIPGEYFMPNPELKVVNDTQILSKDELVLGVRDQSIKVVPTLRAYLSGLEANKVLNFFDRRSTL
ncbi:MAG: hypothetical protein PHY93_21680 [Bacteriovorax sp.]|nr:hypothetical protein [Bacteriovorax sp.]